MTHTTKHFNRLRALAIVAVILTTILLSFILVESGTDGATTKAITQLFSKPIEEATGANDYIPDLAPQKISFSCNTVYYGVPTPLKLSVEPARANPNYTYEFLDIYNNRIDGLSIDENNNIISERLTYIDGGVYLQLKSTVDPSISTKTQVIVNTLDPNDHRIEKIEPVLSNNWLSAVQTSDSYPKVGKIYYHYICASVKEEYLEELGITPENNGIIIGNYGISFTVDGQAPNNGSYHKTEDLYVGNMMCFYAEGSYDFTYTLTSALGKPVSVDASYSGRVDPDFEYIPSYLKIQEKSYEKVNISHIDGECVVTFDKGGRYISIQASVQYPYRNTDVTLDYFDEHSKECLQIENGSIFRRTNQGECYIWAKSSVAPENESLWQKIKVVFNGDTPTSISVIKKNAYMYDTTYKHTVLVNGISSDTFYDEGEVRWTVVEGENNIKMMNGNSIQFKYPGKVTLRVESVSNPELYDEFTVNVWLYDSVYYFVRKILGHALMYLLLGFGFAGIYFLLVKPRWMVALLTPPTILAVGVLGEWLQSMKPGRTPSIMDMTVDFVSGMIGLCIAAVLVTLVCLIWHRVNRQSFGSMVVAFDRLSFLTVLKGAEKLFEEKETAEASQPMDEAAL